MDKTFNDWLKEVANKNKINNCKHENLTLTGREDQYCYECLDCSKLLVQNFKFYEAKDEDIIWIPMLKF